MYAVVAGCGGDADHAGGLGGRWTRRLGARPFYLDDSQLSRGVRITVIMTPRTRAAERRRSASSRQAWPRNQQYSTGTAVPVQL